MSIKTGVLTISWVDRGRAHLVCIATLAILAVKVEILAIWRAGVGTVSCSRVLLDCGYDNLGTRLDVLFAQGSINIGKLSVESVHYGLAIGINLAICVIEKEFVDDGLVLHSEL